MQETTLTKQFDYRPYRRQFRHSLQSPAGKWKAREGFILRMENDDGLVGFGEVAPIPWFGTETLAAAENFLERAAKGNSPSEVPAALPCCRFAISCASSVLRQDFLPPDGNRRNAALLPPGRLALRRMSELSGLGFKTYKWKVGVLTFEEERRVFDELMQELPTDGSLRLDANGAWDLLEAWQWLEYLEGNGRVEFVEDSLDPALWEASFGLAEAFNVSLGLDLPVTHGFVSMLKQRKWPGFLILKPSLLGCLEELQDMVNSFPNTMIFSSSLETCFGYEAVLRLAVAGTEQDAVLGMGGQDLFPNDGLKLHAASCVVNAGSVGFDQLEKAWAGLS